MDAEILAFNHKFVKEKRYESFQADRVARKHLAVVSCMDTRLTELLGAALGLQNGDANIIKNAGAVIDNPYGDVVRSLLIAIYSLKVTKILVVGHTDCGVQGLKTEKLLSQMEMRGIHSSETGVDIAAWLTGFSDVYDSVRHSVLLLRRHPLIPADVEIDGGVMDIVTGELHKIMDTE